MTDVPPNTLAETIRRLISESDFDVAAFWMRLSEDRASYAVALRNALRSEPVAVFIVRDPSFDNANTVLMDLVKVMEANRHDCLQGLGSGPRGTCGVVLLARNELSVPQASSPVTLPEWFPQNGGAVVYTHIQDLTWTADAPLDGPELRAGDLSAAVYALQGQLLRRLVVSHARDRGLANGLFELVRRDADGDKKYDDLLLQWQASHRAVQSERAFRPSVRDATSLVARLWGVTQSTSPDRLARAANHLARVLDLDESALRQFAPTEPLLAVIARPAGGAEAEPVALARIVLVSIAAASRLITTAAHADDYPRYPVPLLRSVSLDLRRSLRSAAQTIEMGHSAVTNGM